MNVTNISLLALLVPSTFLDIKYKKVWLPWIGIFFIESLVLNALGINEWKDFVIGLLPGVILLSISKASNEAIGLGDVYLIIVMGCLAGLHNVIVVLSEAMFLCAMLGVFLIFFRHWGRKNTIPFVPFLLTAQIFQMIAG